MKYFVIAFGTATFATAYVATAIPGINLWFCGIAAPLAFAAICAACSWYARQWNLGKEFTIAGFGATLGSAFGLYVVTLFLK